jgi:hypothetical protein
LIPLAADPRAISSAGRAPPRQGGGHWFEPSIAHRIWPRVYGVFCFKGLTGQVGSEAVFPHTSHTRASGSDAVRMDDVAPERAPESRVRLMASAHHRERLPGDSARACLTFGLGKRFAARAIFRQFAALSLFYPNDSAAFETYLQPRCFLRFGDVDFVIFSTAGASDRVLHGFSYGTTFAAIRSATECSKGLGFALAQVDRAALSFGDVRVAPLVRPRWR